MDDLVLVWYLGPDVLIASSLRSYDIFGKVNPWSCLHAIQKGTYRAEKPLS